MNYNDINLYKHIPKILLFKIMMGEGSIYRNNKVTYMSVPSSKELLDCGCCSSKYYLIINELNNPVLNKVCEQDIDMLSCSIVYLNDDVNNEYWKSFFEENKYLKPLVVNNN